MPNRDPPLQSEFITTKLYTHITVRPGRGEQKREYKPLPCHLYYQTVLFTEIRVGVRHHFYLYIFGCEKTLCRCYFFFNNHRTR